MRSEMIRATQRRHLEDQQRYWDLRWQNREQRRTINEWRDRRHEAILSFPDSLRLDRPNIIDLGCGPGWCTEKSASFGEATGVDVSEKVIAMAKAGFPT